MNKKTKQTKISSKKTIIQRNVLVVHRVSPWVSFVVVLAVAVASLILSFGEIEKANAVYSWSSVCSTSPYDVTISADTVWDNTVITNLYGVGNLENAIQCHSITIDAGKTLTILPHDSVNTRKILNLTGNLTINGTLVLDARNKNTASSGYGMDITVTGNVAVAATGKIDADAKGYVNASGPGAGGTNSGAGYGGQGGHSIGGPTYGSANNSNSLGSGGYFGFGGGLIEANIQGTFSNDGLVTAVGQDTGGNFGDGSGGGVKISANIFQGGGSIIADGGGSSLSTGGGGGRIALYYKTDNNYSGTLSAKGGDSLGTNKAGGAGTIFIARTSSIPPSIPASLSEKELTIKNNKNLELGGSEDYSTYNVSIGKTFIESDNYKKIEIADRTNLEITSGITLSLPGGRITSRNSKISNSGTINVSGADGYFGLERKTRFYNLSLGIVNIDNLSSSLITGWDSYFENQNDTLQKFGDLNLQDYAEMTHLGPNSISHTNTLIIEGNNINIDPTSKINASLKGYSSGNGPGTPPINQNGGAYGGNGGGGGGGDSYGSQDDPNDYGSGGFNGWGNGGGLIKITANGTLTNNGKIIADGENSTAGGGTGSSGAGGGIKIIADKIEGTGAITANGGGVIGANGPAGGGRIAFFYKTSRNFYGQATAYGGIANIGVREGGAGTVFSSIINTIPPTVYSQKELIVANNNPTIGYYSGTNPLIAYTKLTSDNYEYISVRGKALVQVDNGQTINISGKFLELNNSAISNEGNITSAANVSFVLKNGSQFFNRSTGLINLNPASSTTFDGTGTYFENQNNVIQNFGNLAIQNGALFTHKANNDGANGTSCNGVGCTSALDGANGTHYPQSYTLRINAANVYIAQTGKIDVDGKGYGVMRGPGAPSGGGDYSGGGYGGIGGHVYGGLTYGLASDPNDLGSGGWATNANGGGLVRITASGNITVEGTITANGGVGNDHGSGSGGGIKLQTSSGNIIGRGTIRANGGAIPGYVGGGGGRIALIYTKINSDGITITANKGSTVGAPSAGDGTVYYLDGTDLPLLSEKIAYLSAAESLLNNYWLDEGQPYALEPYTDDDNTNLLLHMDGADNGNIFTDSSTPAKTVTLWPNPPATNPITKTNIKRLGTASALFNNVAGQYLTVPYSPDWFFGNGDFTMDLWARFDTIGTSPLLSTDVISGIRTWWISLEGGVLSMFIVWSDNTPTYINATGFTFSPNTWYHIAYVRNGPLITVYINGNAINSVNVGTKTMKSATQPLQIGTYFLGDWINYMDGYLDEVRISNVARWTSNFASSLQSVSANQPTLNITAIKNDGTVDTTFNSSVTVSLTDDYGGQYVFSSCKRVNDDTNCTNTTGSTVTFPGSFFSNGIANIKVTIKDQRTGLPAVGSKHHGFSAFKYNVVSNANYQTDNYSDTLELEDGVPPPILTAGQVAASPFPHAVYFMVGAFTSGVNQFQQDLAGVVGIRRVTPSGSFGTVNLNNRKAIFKVGDYVDPATGSVSSTATDYVVACVTQVAYGTNLYKCNDMGLIPSTTYSYGFFSFDSTYNFFTQDEAANYSAQLTKTASTGAPTPNPVTVFNATGQLGKINLSWNNPVSNVGMTKTIIVRKTCSSQVNCSTENPAWVPTAINPTANDYNVGDLTLQPGEAIIYADTLNLTPGQAVTFDDSAVTAGIWYHYKIYTQYTDESLGVYDYYYSLTTPPHDYDTPIPPNTAPVIDNVTTPVEGLDEDPDIDNVSFSFRVTDADNNNVNVSFSLSPGAPGGCSISGVTGFANPLTGTAGGVTVDPAVWNAKVSCPNQEIAVLDGLYIIITADDGTATTTFNTDPFLLDTAAPTIPNDLSLTPSIESMNITTGLSVGDDPNKLTLATFRFFRAQPGPVADPDFTTSTDNELKFDTLSPSQTVTDTLLSPSTPYSYILCLFDKYGHHSCSNNATGTTGSATLTLSIFGVNQGEPALAGEGLNFDTTNTLVNFGTVSVTPTTKIGALRMVGSIDASSGFIIKLRQNQNLTSGGNVIPGVPGTNILPQTWPINTNSYLGYSTTDSTLLGGTSDRFTSPRKWAQILTSGVDNDPVASTSVIGSATEYLLLKLTLSLNQAPGIYSNNITFLIVANIP